MLINFVQTDNLNLILLEGRFDGNGGIEFEKRLSEFEELKLPIIDFTKVTYLSSAGIRSLLQLEKLLHKRKSKSIYINLSPSLKQVLEITGLAKQLAILDSFDSAKDFVSEISSTEGKAFKIDLGSRSYKVELLGSGQNVIKIWKQNLIHEGFTSVNLNELGFSFGVGAVASSIEQAINTSGDLITTNNFIGFKPYEEKLETDYLLTEHPASTYLFVKSAISLSGKPEAFIDIQCEKDISVQDLVRDLLLIAGQIKQNIGLLGFSLVLNNSDDNTNEGFVFANGLACDHFEITKWKDASQVQLYNTIHKKTDFQNISFKANQILSNYSYSAIEGNERDLIINNIVSSNSITSIGELESDRTFKSAKIWLYIPDKIIDAENDRIKIELDEDVDLSHEFEIIMRNIYSDCSSIHVKLLTGGYSAKTFLINGFDFSGKRIIPTVLKLGSLDLIKREVDRYNEFVQRFILNNSVSVLGSFYYGNYGGVRYNFVGITGPESKLRWLRLHYQEKPIEEFLDLMKKIFTGILLPWYGQPRLELMYPFKEHDPTKVFFPHIEQEALSVLGISSDEETFYIPEIGRDVVNPYWYLKHKYTEYQNNSKLWYKCISHGDLNLQNILIDESNNIYVIDFSETKIRNAVSDFARIEPIVRIENVRIESDDDIKNLLEFEQGLLFPDKLNERPVFTYNGNDPMVEKAYHVVCQLRDYANTVTLFEYDLRPYLLAILEWTLPIVCYKGVDEIKMKYSAYSSALMCEKIIELTKKMNS
jgi:anti-anti-sigma factor